MSDWGMRRALSYRIFLFNIILDKSRLMNDKKIKLAFQTLLETLENSALYVMVKSEDNFAGESY